MSILDTIIARKRDELTAAAQRVSLAELEAAAAEAAPTRAFASALRRQADQPVRVIAEFKRASPSAGAIRAGADIEPIAVQYQEAGAAAISVLTDRDFFDGDLSFLGRAREAVSLPLLRKDFIIDPYQVVEARAAGADAILLIVSALDDALLRDLHHVARSHDLGVLVEVHDEAEAERAVHVGAQVIGVNHRNLKTFTVDMSLSGRIRASLPGDVVVVGESGIRGNDDLRRLRDVGVDAILVGEHLMRAESPGAALLDLLGNG